MNPKILFVDDSDDVRASVARMLSRRFDVRPARTAEEAVVAFDREGPFPVVLTDFALPGMDGVRLLAEIHRHAPEAVGVLLTGVADVDLAVSAVHESGVFRFLTKPCGYESMVQALDEALEHHRALVDAGDEAEELGFERDSLIDLHQSLEERVVGQERSLACLLSFSSELGAAPTLQEVTQLAAVALHRSLRRAVHVQVWDEGDGATVEASAGGEMSDRLHVHPLVTRDGAIGEIVVDLGRGARTGMSEADRALLSAIGTATAVTARHEFSRRERDHAQHATILALARLAEQRDDDTGRHLQRIAAYCRRIAEGLREDGRHVGTITDAWIRDLELSSALHDIGKVGVPDSILRKPARLTPDEWTTMKTHASIGEATLDAVIQEHGPTRFLVMGREIAGGHHEKWDGSGYPRGLRGARIPLSARILAVADVYDALTSARAYKPAWAHAEAVAWIRERAGTHFDPEIVGAFLAREAEFDAARALYADAGPAGEACAA